MSLFLPPTAQLKQPGPRAHGIFPRYRHYHSRLLRLHQPSPACKLLTCPFVPACSSSSGHRACRKRYVNTHIHMHACTRTHTCSHTHTHTHTHTRANTHTHTRTHTHTHTHTRVHTYAHTHACMRTHTHTHIHTHSSRHTHTHTLTHARELTCTGARTHINTHKHTRAHVHTHSLSQPGLRHGRHQRACGAYPSPCRCGRPRFNQAGVASRSRGHEHWWHCHCRTQVG